MTEVGWHSLHVNMGTVGPAWGREVFKQEVLHIASPLATVGHSMDIAGDQARSLPW